MQKINRLSATAVSKLNAKGFYPDGAGLHLQIGKHGGKSWIFRTLWSISKNEKLYRFVTWMAANTKQLQIDN